MDWRGADGESELGYGIQQAQVCLEVEKQMDRTAMRATAKVTLGGLSKIIFGVINVFVFCLVVTTTTTDGDRDSQRGGARRGGDGAWHPYHFMGPRAVIFARFWD